MKALWILGAGGHAKVVIDTVRMAGDFNPVGVLDDSEIAIGARLLSLPIHGPISRQSVGELRIDAAVVAIGDNGVRGEIVRRLHGTVEWPSIVHPRAIVAAGVPIGQGSVVAAGSVIQPDSRIGEHAILNTASSVDHDCFVGNFAHIGPGARLTGGVNVGEGALVGAGATIVPGVRVGSHSIIGAGSVVLGDVPSGVVVVGVPARVVSARDLTGTD